MDVACETVSQNKAPSCHRDAEEASVMPMVIVHSLVGQNG